MIKNLSLVPALVLLMGCAALQSGSDPIVVRAEQVTKASVKVIDSFLRYEYNNRALLLSVNPEIKKTADKMRAEAPKWILEARKVTKIYKINRTPANKANLDTVIKVLEEAVLVINTIGIK